MITVFVRNKMFMTNSKHSNKRRGFTLIELMVSISIFVIVAFIVTSVILTIVDASRRANKIRLIIDNMNFALDSMAVKLKFGQDYEISSDNGTLYFLDRDGNNICYKKAASAIQKCTAVGSTCSTDCSAITTEEIAVTSLAFQNSSCFGGSCNNEEVVMTVAAETTIKNETTYLNFQTAVSSAASQ